MRCEWQRYRDSRRRAIFTRSAFGGAAVAGGGEHLVNLRATRPATGARAATLSDLIHAARAAVDGGLDIRIGGDLAKADVHAELKLVFKSKPVKSKLNSDL
jgi:hypothetical protein